MEKATLRLVLLTFLLFMGFGAKAQINDEITTTDEVFDLKNSSGSPSDALFEVKNEAGQSIFAVYRNGVKIFIDENLKATGGGFSVGRLGTGKSTSTDYFSVNPGNVRVNIPDNQNKATGGGFTVGRLGTGKSGGSDFDFFSVTPNLTQIGVNQAGAMNNNGGFSIKQIGADDEELFTLNNQNAFLGHSSGKSITTGQYNAFLGYESGIATTTGMSNTFVGYNSGIANICGNRNVFIGEKAGFSNTTGNLNTFLGTLAGYANTESDFSTYIGHKAGENAKKANNTCVGYASGAIGENGTNRAFFGYGAGNNSCGDNNTYIGAQAGFNSHDGAKNVYLGYGAGKAATGSGNILIGFNAGANLEECNNTLIIDNSSCSTPLIYGKFDEGGLLQFNAKVGVGRKGQANQLEVEGSASKTVAGNWVANSDSRIKTDIQGIANSFDIIMKLRPVKFKYTNEWMKLHPSIKDKYYYNYIAQEYQTVFPESVQGSGEFLENDNKEILQIDTYNAQIVSVKAIQDLIVQNQQQQVEIDKLKSIIAKLTTDKQALNSHQEVIEAKIEAMYNELVQLKSSISEQGK